MNTLAVWLFVNTVAVWLFVNTVTRCSSVVRAFAHGAMVRRIDPSWGGTIELFVVPASAPRLVYKGRGMCYPICGMVHIKEPRVAYVAAAGFLSHYQNGP